MSTHADSAPSPGIRRQRCWSSSTRSTGTGPLVPAPRALSSEALGVAAQEPRALGAPRRGPGRTDGLGGRLRQRLRGVVDGAQPRRRRVRRRHSAAGLLGWTCEGDRCTCSAPIAQSVNPFPDEHRSTGSCPARCRRTSSTRASCWRRPSGSPEARRLQWIRANLWAGPQTSTAPRHLLPVAAPPVLRRRHRRVGRLARSPILRVRRLGQQAQLEPLGALVPRHRLQASSARDPADPSVEGSPAVRGRAGADPAVGPPRDFFTAVLESRR